MATSFWLTVRTSKTWAGTVSAASQVPCITAAQAVGRTCQFLLASWLCCGLQACLPVRPSCRLDLHFGVLLAYLRCRRT